MLPLERTLLEKLRKIEALHAGTKIGGEREAAKRAAERIRARLEELRGREKEVVLLYSLPEIDLLGGQVQVLFNVTSPLIEYIRTGKLRALGVTASTRSEALPDIPTVGDFVPGYEAIFFSGVGAPRRTPAEIVEKLNREINAVLVDHNTEARIADLGGVAFPTSPAEFSRGAPSAWAAAYPRIAALPGGRRRRQSRATSGHTKTSWATSSPTGGDQAHFRRARIARPITQSLSLSDRKLSSSVKWVTRWR
jgi:Tripartite tricarboxylate transporter family receptor